MIRLTVAVATWLDGGCGDREPASCLLRSWQGQARAPPTDGLQALSDKGMRQHSGSCPALSTFATLILPVAGKEDAMSAVGRWRTPCSVETDAALEHLCAQPLWHCFLGLLLPCHNRRSQRQAPCSNENSRERSALHPLQFLF